MLLFPRQGVIEPTIPTKLPFDLPTVCAICAFIGLTWANVAELNIRIWSFFKVHRGLYFWSLLIASWATAITAFAITSMNFVIIPNDYVNVAIIFPGWIGMVSGEALVMYSRLHLVMRNRTRMRWVLYMIIFNAICFHTPTGVINFLAVSPYLGKPAYLTMEKIQVTVFCVQEMIISLVYIYETYKMLKPGEAFRKTKLRTILMRLIYINISIICMDFVILGTQYADRFEIQSSFKCATYAIKLRLEFTILNQLMRILGRKAENSGRLIQQMGDGRDNNNNGNSDATSGADALCWSGNTMSANSSQQPASQLSKAAATLKGKPHHDRDQRPQLPVGGDARNDIQMTREAIVTSKPQHAASPGRSEGVSLSEMDDEKESGKSTEGFNVV